MTAAHMAVYILISFKHTATCTERKLSIVQGVTNSCKLVGSDSPLILEVNGDSVWHSMSENKSFNTFTKLPDLTCRGGSSENTHTLVYHVVSGSI